MPQMHSEITGLLGQDEAEEYLAHLQGLAVELEGAMEAIVKGELPSLRRSLHVQEATCARLEYLGRDPEAKIEQGSDLAAEIMRAAETLLLLNQRYSALLKHSGETLRLFAGLFRSYHSSAQFTPSVQAGLQTWSCEI